MATTIKKPDNTKKYTNLAGISDASKQNLNYYGQGYQQSQAVKDANKNLQNILKQKPGEFSSQYDSDIQDLYSQVMNRPQFQYEVNDDPLWQSYKNAYTVAGQKAMQDTVGSAAALTGGYGNSYAATAGNQAYQGYLQQMTDKIPELARDAYSRYEQEGQNLRSNLGIAQGLRDTEYGQYRDKVGDWQQDRQYAQSAYDSAYNRDYSAWMNMLSYWQQMAQAENQSYYNKLSADLAQKQYEFQLQQYKDAQAKKSGGGGGGGRSSGSSGIQLVTPSHPVGGFQAGQTQVQLEDGSWADAKYKEGMEPWNYSNAVYNYDGNGNVTVSNEPGATGFKSAADAQKAYEEYQKYVNGSSSGSSGGKTTTQQSANDAIKAIVSGSSGVKNSKIKAKAIK